MTEIVAPLLLGLPLLGSEHLLAVLVFLGFSGAGNPADLAPNLPAETMAYVRLTHRPEAAALVKKALEGARGEDGEFRILMDRLLEKIEKEGGFRERGFRELASRITGIHFVVYGFSDDGPFFSLVFEMTGEEAALEVLDHSDRFFQEPIFQKLEGEGKYRFGPAGEEGNCLRVKNLLVFGNRAEETAAGLRTAPVASLASSKTYQAAVGESGSDSILLAYGDGQKFFSALRGVLDLDDQQEFDKVDAYVGFSEIEWARISCNLADGRLVNETVVAFPEDAILRTFAPKPAPLDADLVLLAGGAGTMFLSVDDLPGYWERVKGHLLEQEKTLGGRDLAEGLEEFEKGMGRSLEEILSLVDGRIAVGLPSMSEMMETDRAMDGEKEVRDFPVGFAARLADPAKAGEFIDWLFKEGPLSEGVERLEPETADGVTIHGFVIDDTRLRYAIDGNHLVVGGSGIKEAFARARSPEAEKMKAALAERFARLGAPGFLGYSSGGVGSGGMGGMMFFMLMARSRAMWAEGMATIERKAKVLRIRQPIQTGSSELDGTIRFAPLGLVGRSVAALDAGGLRASAGDILRMTWREDVDGCMQSLAMLHNLVQLYRQNNEKWPATLADAMSQEEHRWWMRGCPEVEGSNQNPGSAYTYIAEKPAGLSDEGALWIYESEERHPFGRACLFRDSTVRFLYSDEFEKTLAKQK